MSAHLEKELVKLKKNLLHMSALVEEDSRKAVMAITTRDVKLAREVIDKDCEIDAFENELEEECLKILALHQPVAADLRFVVACLKINNDLERVGDLSVKIAKRAIAIAEEGEGASPIDFSVLMDRAQRMLKLSLDALMARSSYAAGKVLEGDDEVDALNKDIRKKILQLIKENPGKVEYFISLMNVSRNLERIADCATSIAEDVIYMIEGEIVRHGGVGTACCLPYKESER